MPIYQDNAFPDRQSKRLKWFDYSRASYYFVTICTLKHFHAFGSIQKDAMQLNEAGLLAQKTWVTLPDRYPGIDLDDHIIMPNHLHGIIVITPSTNIQNMPQRFQASKQAILLANTQIDPVSYIPPTLSAIVRTFKAATTRFIRTTTTPEFSWQTRYWDSIIRDTKQLHNIREYIRTNPQNWLKDKLYTPPNPNSPQ
jgi:putative transposase